ncbi:phosphate starvation-inducible protein [Erythrobacter phage vB_EliS-L02]|nr:phosphate starvation-inducible protein [Erythrobacter phage vB_EliS-L02]
MARRLRGTGAKKKRGHRKSRTNPASKQSLFPSHYPKDHPLMSAPIAKKRPPQLKANSRNQKVYLKKLRQHHHDILFATGPAGTGKTYMAVRQAISDFEKGDITKIVITRPNVTTGDDLGYLPGTLTEKMAPWTRPIIDVFAEVFDMSTIHRMLQEEIIEIAPLAYMRGRTFKNCIVIADEMQNATIEQMKMLMTRIGEGCQMIITGDTDQWDRQIGNSGLADITRRIEEKRTAQLALPGFITGQDAEVPSDASHGFADDHDDEAPRRYERIGLVKLTRDDVCRHPVIEEVLELYSM